MFQTALTSVTMSGFFGSNRAGRHPAMNDPGLALPMALSIDSGRGSRATEARCTMHVNVLPRPARTRLQRRVEQAKETELVRANEGAPQMCLWAVWAVPCERYMSEEKGEGEL